MAPTVCHLPNGHNVTVTPVFGGLAFKSTELSNPRSPVPPGWTIILNSEDEEEDHVQDGTKSTLADKDGSIADLEARRKHHVHRYREPSLQNDHLFISSISNPSNNDFRPAVSPTRQIAMMLWTTLWWYFHQPEPDARIVSKLSKGTAEGGRPKGEWKVYINREGVLKGKHTLQKLVRMGLIMNEDSSVGMESDVSSGGWSRLFVSKRQFWQMDARIYLFTLSPTINSPFPSSSPSNSRPSSPNRSGPFSAIRPGGGSEPVTPPLGGSQHGGQWPTTTDPFQSTSHLPTYYPPPPALYTFTGNIRHALRPKPPRQGEVFYTRYIPSLGQYLSFRVASLGKIPVAHAGPVSPMGRASPPHGLALRSALNNSDQLAPPTSTVVNEMSDVEYLHKWMNDDRVAFSWGEQGPIEHQQAFLETGLKDRHSFPVIGCFDGKPFGYFEIYWVKEDRLGLHLGGNVGNWDRGLHCLVGEQEFRGSHRVKVWLSALVHYCWLADTRTDMVLLEPRVDNEK